MIIIGDKRMPEAAKKKLSDYGEILPFETKGIVYEAISGHPDIFFTRSGRKLIVAPNIPETYRKFLSDRNITYVTGKSNVGSQYPATAQYNAVITARYFIHNLKLSDENLRKLCSNKESVFVSQGYTRCNLLPLSNRQFITSDEGIYKALLKKDFDVLFVKANGILLPGLENGFIGGVAGVYKQKFFFMGNLDFFPEGEKIRRFLTKSAYEIIELYKGPLYDGGSLIFLVEEE